MLRPDFTGGSSSVAAAPKLSPKRLYGFLAAAEMVTWALLIISMVIKYGVGPEIYVRIFGMVHGVVFIAYGLVTLFVWANERWSVARGVLGLFSAVIPFATLPFERAMLRRGLLSDAWRLAPGGEAPQGPIEKLQAMALRSPWLATAVGLVAVAVITAALLVIGPPGGTS
jgi:integral membrane protein